MIAGYIDAPHSVKVVETELPTYAANDVLIRVKAAGICGTDIHIYKGEYEATYPLIPGHEFSGEVEAVGKHVTRFAVGDRVTVDPNIPCNKCHACQQNQPNQCENLAAIGVTRHGGFAEYVVAPEGNVFRIGSIPYDEAALVEPLACVVWGLQRIQPQVSDTALVLGAGPMGCLVAAGLAKAGATKIVVTDIVAQRLQIARDMGATHTLVADEKQNIQLNKITSHGFDIVADATGVPNVMEDAMKHIRPRGKFWVFGVAPKDSVIQVSPYDIFRKDISIIGSFAVNRTFHESIALIESGAINVRPLISHRLDLNQFSEGFGIAQHDPNRMKIQFTLGGK